MMLLEPHERLASMQLKFPGGPLPADSPFYVQRGSLETLAAQELEKVGCLIRIQAPKRMGKSSFLTRLLNRANDLDYRIVTIDFLEADDSIFVSLDRFLRWFCANVSRRLGQSSKLDEFWDEDLGSKVSCTYYFEDYVLDGADRPLVLAFNEVNRVFDYPDIAKDFLPLLRFWNEQSRQNDLFAALRMVVVHSTEVYVPLQIHQSPFNIGCPIKLLPFTLEQAQTLSQRYELSDEWANLETLKDIWLLVGGSPYRLSLVFYYAKLKSLTIDSVLSQAIAPSGVFAQHLEETWSFLNQSSELRSAFEQVVQHQTGFSLAVREAYCLNSLDLVALNGLHATVSCPLYLQYFAQKFKQQALTQPPTASLPADQETFSEPDSTSVNVTRPLSKPPSVSKTPSIFLGGRYEVDSLLGAGGFGTTYLAKDTHRPGQPQCVVKKLKREFEPLQLENARRLFEVEAQTLEKLGEHPQIPRLLAYFEQDEDFFLVQEWIDGQLFGDELSEGCFVSNEQIIDILLQLLGILEFLHQHQVIHRDIKPDNIIRRATDKKLVLIDFGSVKFQVPELESRKKTIAIGTQGYTPWEQNQGLPNFNSDIYALGIIAIELATGCMPCQLQRDNRMELIWRPFAQRINPWLVSVIDGMVKHNYQERYQSAIDVIKDLNMIASHG